MVGICRSSIVRAFASGGPKSFRRCLGAFRRSGCRKGAIPRGRIGRRRRNRRGSKMANERRSEALTGPRDLDLEDHILEVERAAADWGVHVDALEGRFVGALLAAIRESGRTNLAVLGDIEALLERARATGEGELRRIGLMIEASQQTLSMAQEAAETSAASGERAERVFNASVAKIAKELSVKLLDECQQWLVLKQPSTIGATQGG